MTDKPETTRKITAYGITTKRGTWPFLATIRSTKGEAIAAYTHTLPNGVADFMAEGYRTVKIKIELSR